MPCRFRRLRGTPFTPLEPERPSGIPSQTRSVPAFRLRRRAGPPPLPANVCSSHAPPPKRLANKNKNEKGDASLMDPSPFYLENAKDSCPFRHELAIMAAMGAQYDAIGATYAGWKETPVPKYSEVPTVERLLAGQIEGRAVLDLACGTGFYSRLFKQWDAAKVVGVDVSEAMIAAAREIEARDRLGIEYVVADAADMPVLGAFDVATATYLLHYAETPEMMGRMGRNIAANLKPGGLLFALLPEPDYVMGKGDTELYYFTYRTVTTGKDWMLVHADVHTEPPFSIEYRHWKRDVYEQVLHAAGFTELQWHPFMVSSEGLSKFGEAYWRDILANPVSIVLTARLPA